MNENAPDEALMNLTARIAQSAYVRNKADRQKLVNEYNPDLRLLDNYSDKHHSTFQDNDGNIYLGVRGTDISNTFKNRYEDLITDAFVTLGLESLTPRYKRSEKLLKKIQQENQDKKINLVGHSLGGTITRALGFKHNLHNYNFSPGYTYMHLKTNILKYHPETQKKREKSHIFITDAGDPISSAAYGDLLSQVHVIPMKKLPKKKRGILQSHSIYQFF